MNSEQTRRLELAGFDGRRGVKAELARLLEGSAVNTTLIQDKQLAQFDAVVLDAINHIPPKPHHPAEKRLLIGIQNERGEVYRVIKIFGLFNFLDLIGKFRDLGFTDEFAQHAGDKEGFDAILSFPQKS